MIQTVTLKLREGGQRLGTGQTKAGFSTQKCAKMQTFSILRRNSARKKEKYTSALKYIEFCQKSQYKTAISGLLVKMAKTGGVSLAVPPLDREK
jgi:hypothetical protein